MADHLFHLVADVSSDDPLAIEPVLRALVQGHITPLAGGLHIEADMTGASAGDLNRTLLSGLRRAHRKTRLRAEWSCAGVAYRFFDHVAKGSPATESPPEER
jgi:hypothetical protein